MLELDETHTRVESQRTLLVVPTCRRLAMSGDGRHVVCVSGRRVVSLCDTKTGAVRSMRNKVAVGALAVSPNASDGIVALGDIAGRITLWRCLSNETFETSFEECVSTSMHWHSHGVNALCKKMILFYILFRFN